MKAKIKFDQAEKYIWEEAPTEELEETRKKAKIKFSISLR